MLLPALSGCLGEPEVLDDLSAALTDGGTSSDGGAPFIWSMSGVHGGGMGQVIATDPFNAGRAILGGDSWGIYKTTSAGNDWRPATRNNPGQQGDFHFVGVAYSRKYPGRAYALTGQVGSPNGGFWSITGDECNLITRAVQGGENGLDRSDRPRPSGSRVLIDYDTVTGVEYIYVATGAAGGVKRSTDQGQTWTTIGLGGQSAVLTGLAFAPGNTSSIFVSSRSGAYRIGNARATASTTKLTAAPPRVEEFGSIGVNLYAVAHTSGVYRVTNSGKTWTKLGVGFFPTTSEWAAVGGTGSTVYVGCANPNQGKSIAKSTDNGNTWTWVTSDPSKISIQIWGRSDQWWLAQAVTRIIIGNSTYEAAQIAVDQFNPQIVYVAGRSGCWKSEDGGGTWRPAVNHLGGTMHTNIAAGPGGQVGSAVLDWDHITSDDHYYTARQSGPADYGAVTLDLTKGGVNYKVVQSIPRDFLRDGVSIADDYFRTACVRAEDIDVSDDGDYIYIAQFGGGVLVGHRGPWPE